MSIAGIHSNRGDGYQTLVAFDWALTVLSDQEFDWIEIDSPSYEVDDIVIGKTDGSVVCCQCKKNQQGNRMWSVSDLSGELKKAFALLATDEKAEVRFYSRTPFGALSTLREHNVTQNEEGEYLSGLGKAHRSTESALLAAMPAGYSNPTTFYLMRRIRFEPTAEMDRMKSMLRERLRNLVSNPRTAYDALWRTLDELGARMDEGNASASFSHRLYKSDLQAILNQAGSLMAPPIDESVVRQTFENTSAIGRSWHRDIAGKLITPSVLGEIVSEIEKKKRSILLTGLPGSGKTCVMLSLQEVLEQRAKVKADIVPLFIQSREFADIVTSKEREAIGLPESWVKQVARISERTHTVVVIDSLDVLSIAREHRVLTYFLAQIDQLLLIPNVTVVTACRDFDRRYDRRIAEREWESELECKPFSWDVDVSPLLLSLDIDLSIIDQETRELIQNPRELALFVELAQREGSFNAVTSQSLAQKYLDAFVLSDNLLGNEAIKAIESIANDMLLSRRLSVPRQRFSAPQEILRRLLSLNVLRETVGCDLTFGHQTLLDVLVISRAIRQSVSLNEFINDLPPVPFVRPSIRSFAAQLASKDRREFRKQTRAVLTSSAAFHIRRLVAETFTEQVPQKDDWPLVRDLRNNHREIFQVIYVQAQRIDWHHFWLEHLIPMLKALKDKGALATHIHQIGRWKQEDPEGVISFWSECMELDWLDTQQIANGLPYQLDKLDSQHFEAAAPILKNILKLPREKHSFLGHAVARYVDAGVLDVLSLWHYIAGEITDEDVLKFRFDQKLHCQTHEFIPTDEDFLTRQMTKSSELLELAIKSVEKWSEINSAQYQDIPGSGFHSHFHLHTSYRHNHTKHDFHHIDAEDVLFEAIENAISNHAKNDSLWWKENRTRICFSKEGALRYIGIICCISSPAPNIDLIERIFSTPDIFRSKFSFELGSLIEATFILMPSSIQDKVLADILSLKEDYVENGKVPVWVQKDRAELVTAIPCHLRSQEAQSLLDEYEILHGNLDRQPDIEMWGGTVHAPFSYEVFLKIQDREILRLLDHYDEYEERPRDISMTGGAREVGGQLRDASSRMPSRFLELLSDSWQDIPNRFKDDILDGAAHYLSYRYSNLQPGNKWESLENPDGHDIVLSILDELEKHPLHWHHKYTTANALEACSHVISNSHDADRLVFLTIDFASFQEKERANDQPRDYLSRGLNMVTGEIVRALMTIANKLTEENLDFPELLAPTLRRFARNAIPEIRAAFLHELPYFQSLNHEMGWELFHLCMDGETEGLWSIAERCLYYSYHNHFEIVGPLLQRIPNEGEPKDMETWGRISALSSLSSTVNNQNLIERLISMNLPEAWDGAASVWTHDGNFESNREQCLLGIEAGLATQEPCAKEVAQQVTSLFKEDTHHIHIPSEIIRLCVSVFEKEEKHSRRDLFMFDAWVNARSQFDPDHALEAAEIYLSYMSRTEQHLHDYKDSLTQLMTRLFAEAEEREESDNGDMLVRVVALQDTLLSLGADTISDWLKSAERP